MMNKLTTLLMLLALTLPMSALAQPDDEPRERPDRERPEHRERPERPDRFGGGPMDRERGGTTERSNKREPLSADQVEEALATLRDMHGQDLPPWLKRVEQQAQESPEKAAKALSRFPRIREMMHARKNSPEEFELHAKQGRLMRDVFPMVREIRQAKAANDQAKVDELTPQIRERIEQLFQVRLALKELEIQQLRDKLAKAEQELTDIKSDGETLINEKMNEIMSGKRPERDRDERHERDR